MNRRVYIKYLCKTRANSPAERATLFEQFLDTSEGNRAGRFVAADGRAAGRSGLIWEINATAQITQLIHPFDCLR